MGVVDALISLGDRVSRIGRTPDTPVVEWLDIGTEQVAIERIGSPSGSGPHPLILSLHGFGSSEHQMKSLVPLPAMSEQAHHIAIRGGWTVADGGHAWFPIRGSSIDDISADPAHVDAATERLVAIIDALSHTDGVDGRNVWIVGYSPGAPMALHVLASHPTLLRGVAVGAGTFLDASDRDGLDATGTHCFVAASTGDSFVSSADYEQLATTLESAGAEVTVVTEHVPHVISASQATEIDHWLARSTERDRLPDDT